jgi:HPt (histidine-containing phosphotransfer) domain-containing protein
MDDGLIDRAALRRLLEVIGGDPEDFAELVDDYFAGAPELVASIRAGADSGDWEAVYRAAHTLKSNAKDFGALRLAALCATLESAARQGAVDSPEVVIAEIEREEAAARQALQAIRVSDVAG